MNQELLDLKKIKLFVYDFDGVMTDNTFSLDEKGNEKVFSNLSDDLAVNDINELEAMSQAKLKIYPRDAQKSIINKI